MYVTFYPVMLIHLLIAMAVLFVTYCMLCLIIRLSVMLALCLSGYLSWESSVSYHLT